MSRSALSALLLSIPAAALSAGETAPGRPATPVRPGALLSAAPAAVHEVEPNPTPASATDMGGISRGITALGRLTPGDVDVWGTWLGFPAGPSQWGFDLTVVGSASLEVQVAQLVVMPLDSWWTRLERRRGQGRVEFHQPVFEHWPQAPPPYLFVRVTGDPQAYTITAF